DNLLALIDDLQPGVRADSNQLGQPRGNRRPVPGEPFQALEYGYLQQLDAGLALTFLHDETHQAQALALARLAEAHGQRRAAVADVLRVVDHLRYVQMAEGDIVEARREQAGVDMRQRPHVKLTHTIALDGLATGGKQVAGRDYRQVRAELCPAVFRQSGHDIVM